MFKNTTDTIARIRTYYKALRDRMGWPVSDLIAAIESDLAAFDAMPSELEQIAAALRRLRESEHDMTLAFCLQGDESGGVYTDHGNGPRYRNLAWDECRTPAILAAIEEAMPKPPKPSIAELEEELCEARLTQQAAVDAVSLAAAKLERAKAERKGGA